jgi:hypothetical protein
MHHARPTTAPLVLLGPQGAGAAGGPAGGPTVGAALADLGVRGQVAIIRAGYQEREADDAEHAKAIGLPIVNLKLHARAVEVFATDPEFTKAYQARQLWLRNVQACYRVRLDKTDDAAKAIAVRYIEAELLAQEDAVSVEQFRQLDVNHLDRCQAVRHAFTERWLPATRPIIARHRAELRAAIEASDAVVIAGGHVASLLNRLELFDILPLTVGKPVIAWSAGAMVLTDRIVLFHDSPPYGSDIAQVLDAGLGLAPGIVVLPDPRRRIRLDDRAGIARFAARMAPATCVAMDIGAKVRFDDRRLTTALAMRLAPTGEVDASWTGAAA